jgi:hypothetical protein
MKSKLFAGVAIAGLMFAVGCNNAAITRSTVDVASVPAESKAILKPGVELVGAEELTYSGGKKTLLLRYKTPEGITDTVEVDNATTQGKPGLVFEAK